MRIDSPEYSAKNKSRQKSPVYVVEISFDDANTDTHYLTTKAVSGLTGNMTDRCLTLVNRGGQKLNPDKANSTIGTMKFKALDLNLTDLIRTKLNEDKGLKGKRVVLYKGYRGLIWSQFTRINTYQIDKSITFNNGVYNFTCADVQRSIQEKIFVVKESKITQSLSADDTEINLLDASGFQTVYQVPSATGLTLLRGLQQQTDESSNPKYPTLIGVDEIGIIRIESSDGYELAIWTEKEGNKLKNLIRGVLGTKAIDVELSDDEGSQNQPSIKEYVYMSMPALKALYAIYTGSLYGHAGKFLPDHWHLGISTDYIQTSAFVNIGADLWDLADDDKGFPVHISGREDVSAKKFIEENILYMMGLYPHINRYGEIKLQRSSFIGAAGSYVRLLNRDNVVSYSPLDHDQDSMINDILIKWHKDEKKDEYTRRSPKQDSNSITRNGKSALKIVELDTLHGSRHSSNSIKYHFDSTFARYSNPPLRISVTLTPDQDDIETGDIVRLDLTEFEDYTNEAGKLNRNFEVQQVKFNKRSGRPTLLLFGSSQPATPQAPTDDDIEASQNTAFLTGTGTEINTANFPGAVSSSGGITTVTGNITLSGHSDLNNASAIYYCSEDLTFAASATVTVTLNVQLRVDGFFQNNGAIDGEGKGFAGGVSDFVVSHNAAPIALNLGSSGIGNTVAQGGMLHAGDSTNSLSDSHEVRKITGTTAYLEKPMMSLSESGELVGAPSTLMGSSGSSGGGIHSSNTGTIVVKGGPGGDGGAGFMAISKGSSFGATASINLSGTPGGEGELYSKLFADASIFSNPKPPAHGSDYMIDLAYAGAGAGGCPGGFLPVTLDSNQAYHAPTAATVILNHAGSLEQGAPRSISAIRTTPGSGGTYIYDYATEAGRNKGDLPACSNEGGGAVLKETENLYELNAHVVFLDTKSTPEDNASEYVETDPTFTLTEKINTPVTPDGNRSTIEISVTPPPDTNYSYSLVDYRKLGESAWGIALPASHESLIEVESDGSIYEIRIRPVSKNDLATDTGPTDTITVTDINGRTDVELALIYPFDAIAGLGIQETAEFVFYGPSADFVWDDDNNQLAYFNFYLVEIYSAGQLLRTEKSVSPHYSYTYDKNASDYKRITSNDGVYLSIEIRVKPVSKYFNNLTELYSGAQVAFTATATTDISADNLRYITTPTELEQAIQDAGDTAQWSNVSDDDGNMPEDNATNTTDTAQLTDGAGLGNTANWDDINNSPEDSQILNSVLDSSDWQDGQTGSTNNFTFYVSSSANTREIAAGPFGEDEVVWVVDGNGGWDSDLIQINHLKAYRLCLWVKPIDFGGFKRFRSNGVSAHKGLNDQVWSSGATFKTTSLGGQDGKWLLFVGYIFPSTATRTVDTLKGGVYSPDTGELIETFPDFKFSGTATEISHQFEISGVTGSKKTQLCRPRIDVIDGNETSIGSMLGLPTRLTSEATLGLNLTNQYLGYYNGTSWTSYMNGQGHFYLDGDAENSLSWDGSTLSIVGAIQAKDIKTASSGQRVEVLSSDNQIHSYWDRGDGTIEELVTIGNTGTSGGAITIGSSDFLGPCVIATTNGVNRIGIGSWSKRGTGIYGNTEGDTSTSSGVWGQVSKAGSAAYGVHGSAQSTGYDFYASGAGTNYGPFTGGHDALLPKSGPLYVEGDIVKVSSIAARSTISNVLAEIEVQDIAEAKDSFGVLVWSRELPEDNTVASMSELSEAEYQAYQDSHFLASVNGVGEGQINVCNEGGGIEIGDHICTSSVLGKGKCYDGFDMRLVVARAIEAVNWSQEINSIKTIACIYMCG